MKFKINEGKAFLTVKYKSLLDIGNAFINNVFFKHADSNIITK